MDTKNLERKKVFWSNKWDKIWLLVIPTMFLIDIFTSNKYSDFWFWAILVLASSFNIDILYHMFHPKFAWVDTSTKKGKEIQKQAFEIMYNDDGVFEYKNDGFNFTDKDQTTYIL